MYVLWRQGVAGARQLMVASVLALSGAACMAGEPGASMLAPPAVRENHPQGQLDVRLLDQHPEVQSGVFKNGTQWYVLPHTSPADALTIRAHLHVGTLSEPDDQLGAAQLVARLVQRRLADAPADTPIGAARDRLRIDPDRDFHVDVAFSATTFTLVLPNVDASRAIEAGALLANLLDDHLPMTRESIDLERRLAAEQRRAEAGVIQRLNTVLWPRLVPGSKLVTRLPEKVDVGDLWTLDAEQLRAFYKQWYAPAVVSVIAIGDLSADELAKGIEPFGLRAARAASKLPDAELTLRDEPQALVVHDAELSFDVVELVSIQPSLGGVRDTESARAKLIEKLGMLALNRRLTDRITSGAMTGQVAMAIAYEAVPMRASLVIARGEIGSWKRLVSELAVEVQRCVTLGFTDAELSIAAEQLLADTERAASAEGALPHAPLIERISDAIVEGSTIRSARQDAEFARAVLASGVPASEVSAALRARLAPDRNACVILAPDAPGDVNTPTEPVVLDAYRAALTCQVAQIAEKPVATRMLDELPKSGSVRELSMQSGGVSTALLSSGVVIHHRRMDAHDGRVTVSVSLVGGLADESASTRGLTQAFGVLFRNPASASRSSRDMRALLAGKDVRFTGMITEPRVTLTISAARAELEAGMQLLHLLLKEPVVETQLVSNWRDLVAQGASMRAQQPEARALELMIESLSPDGDRRLLPLNEAEARAIDPSAAQKWVTKLCTTAPAEAAIVGDIPLKEAVELASRYLGSLTSRQAVQVLTPARGPCVHPDCAPLNRSVSITTPTREKAVVFVGFRGADCERCVDGRALALSADILTTRLSRQLRDDRQIVTTVVVTSRPVERFPGSGQFWAAGVCDPARADELAAAVESAIADFAHDGPTAREMSDATARLREQAERQLVDPAFWATELSSLTQRGRSASDIIAEPAAIGAMSADELREHFAPLSGPDRKIRVIVRPAK